MKTMNLPKKTFRISALLLVVCMISTVMLSGTFAKYTSKYSGKDTALVARWSFGTAAGTLDSEDTMGTDTELALFDHLYDTYINQTDGEDTPKFILAPGVSDEFTVKMDYIADVDADVLIAITPLAGNADVPIEYSVDNGAYWVTLTNLSEALAAEIASGDPLTDPTTGDATFRIAKVATDAVDDINISQTVKWRWAYDSTQQTGNITGVAASSVTVDTSLGEASQLAAAADITNRTTYGIKITLTATQVVPTI